MGDERKTPKKLILNAFVESCSGHHSPGLWRHPEDKSSDFTDIQHWIGLVKLMESAKIHGIFIADVLGGYDVYQGPRNLAPAIRSGAQWPVHEPLSLISAMAAATTSIGFGVTVSTTYEQPYSLARRLSTIDHLSNGRLGWNIVTGYLDSAARNLGHTKQPEHDNRYAVAEEYMRVMYKLLQSSWRDDAVVLDRTKNIFCAPERVREINHSGQFYNVTGPHICQPSPQRTPLLLQAGTSRAGRRFAAQHAEVVFVAAHRPELVAENVAIIRDLAKKEFGRDPRKMKFLAMFTPIIGKTPESAEAKYKDIAQYISKDGFFALFGGWTGIDMHKYADDEELRHVESNAMRSAVEAWTSTGPGMPTWNKRSLAEYHGVGALGARFVGSPEQVAEEMQRWVDVADVDGFNLAYALFPGSFEDIAYLLVPELQARGMFWDDYAVPHGTYRENFYGVPGQKQPPEEHVASTYKWRAGVPQEDHPIPA